MKGILIIFSISISILVFYAIVGNRAVLAQPKVVINEFLIDPQPQQVEIINIGNEQVNISGWNVDDSGGLTFYTIPQNSILYPNSCLVFSGDFNLNKTSADIIRLINNQEIIDSFSYKSSSGSGISYYRLPDGDINWTTGSANLGLFNSSKLSCYISPTQIPTVALPLTNTPTPTTTIEPEVPLTPELTPTAYNGIYISEVMVNPNTGNNEWIEFYNNNDFLVYLINWYVDDLENSGSSPKKFSLEIPAFEYKAFNLNSSMFNNNGDSVRLLDFNKELKDDFEYKSSVQGKTWGRITVDNDDFCLQEASYEKLNNACLNQTSTTTTTPSVINTPASIKTSISDNKIVTRPLYNQMPINQNLPSPRLEDFQGQILGTSSTKMINNQLLKVRTLSFLSLSYSLLTIFSVLFKMKFIYGQVKKILSSFIYTDGY